MPNIHEQTDQLRYFAGPLDWRDNVVRFKWSPVGPLEVRRQQEDDGNKSAAEEEEEWNVEGKQAAEDTRYLRGQYVSSIVGRSRAKTLHKVGECHRLPGLRYKEFEVLGDEAPCTSRYHKACGICFPSDASKADLELASSDDSEVSSSDSTGSGE